MKRAVSSQGKYVIKPLLRTEGTLRVHLKRTPGIALRATLLVMLIGLAACARNNEDRYVARDVEVLYHLGVDRLEKRQYQLAAAVFDEVERQHPYSPWARQAQLMTAYAAYQANEYEDAILAAQRFLTLHPGNKAAPYAYYLIAVCHYEQITDVGRDQRVTEDALRALTEVVRRFPDSDYARDAQLKLDMTMDHLAGKEMTVGRFYERQGQYLAAIGRFRTVIEKYQTTSHVPEALHRLVESYTALGIEPEAEQVAAVLGYNFPESKWYRRSYRLVTGKNVSGDDESQSLFSKIFGIF